MVNPCEVCYGPAQCDQCYFGYIGAKEAHERFKKVLLDHEAGNFVIGEGMAETFKREHPNWKEMLEVNV